MSTAHHYAITGMHCAGCVASVERALQAVPGVNTASVSLADETVIVDGQAANDDVIQAIADVGYQARVLASEEDEADKLREDDDRYRSMIRRSIVAGVVGFPLMALGMAGYLPGLDNQTVWLAIAALSLGVLIYSGGDAYLAAWQSAKRLRADMHTLIALGTGAAWLFSLMLVVIPGLFEGMSQHAYFEAAAIILCLINFGNALELKVKRNTGEAIRRLILLQPSKATVVRDGEDVEVDVADIQSGDVLRVRPGDRVPVDGEITKGESTIDESMLTGESLPVDKAPGDTVSAGTMNQSGSFLFVAERVGSETALSQIISLVRNAQASKPAIGRMVDRVAEVFVPAVIAVAVMTFLAWTWVAGEITPIAIVTSMTVLIIACPCALGLATPISITVGIGKAAEYGALIRNGDALQQAATLDTIVLDKTGTVTRGEPEVNAVVAFGDTSQDAVVQFAASLEQGSEHPLARAILAANSSALLDVDSFEAANGLGVTAQIEGQRYRLGNLKFVNQTLNIEAPDEALTLESQGQTVLYLASDEKLVGIIGAADQARDDSASAIRRLRQLGMEVMLLTGDNQATADAIAAEVGIDRVLANVMPGDKAATIEKLQSEGRKVAMVGDGINDAPALVQADVGFAMSMGSDVAIESADVTLMRGSVSVVADAIEISRAALTNIKQNLFGAFIYNTLGIPVAAGIAYPLLGVLLNPMIAGGAMAMSSVTVVSNANRLRLFKPTASQALD